MSIKNYETTDLGEAAAIYCAGFELVDLLETDRSNRMIFRFNKKADTPTRAETPDEVAKAYWDRANGFQVDAQEYFLAVKNLKRRVYDKTL